MFLPSAGFWILIFIGRGDLGLKAILVSVAIWAGLLYGFMSLGIRSYFFVAAQALLDIILILIIFSGDIRIR